MINVAVLGHGTIGSGVVEVLQTNAAVIAKRVGEDIAVKYILDLRDFPGDPNADSGCCRVYGRRGTGLYFCKKSIA